MQTIIIQEEVEDLNLKRARIKTIKACMLTNRDSSLEIIAKLLGIKRRTLRTYMENDNFELRKYWESLTIITYEIN